MAGQHIENLFRRYKGETVIIKTASGAVIQGRVLEITNDYVCLAGSDGETSPVFVFFNAIESVAAASNTSD